MQNIKHTKHSGMYCHSNDKRNENKKRTAIENTYPLNVNGVKLPNEKPFVNGIKKDRCEYRNKQNDKNKGYAMYPEPLHLQSQQNNNNNVLSSNFNTKTNNWKLRVNTVLSSQGSEESDESCKSTYALRKETLHRQPSPETKIRRNFLRNGNNRHRQEYPHNKNNNKDNILQQNSYLPNHLGPVQSQLNSNSLDLQRNHHKSRHYHVNLNCSNNNNNNNRQKWDNNNKRYFTDIHKRVYGLMERFSSRSHLMKITKPMNLFGQNKYSQLTQSIWDVFINKAQKEETYLRKLELWKLVYLNIRKTLTKYGLFMVGSTMSGLGTESSDIDMCLLVRPCLSDPRSDALSYLQNIYNVLLNCDFVVAPEVILAKVPILKFRDAQYGFEVDLNCNNAVGIRNTHLLHCYAYLDWRVRPLVVTVKIWAQANNINDAKKMTISSYSLVLMVIHYLQCGVSPPAIPCLHMKYPHKFNANTDIRTIDVQEELPEHTSENTQSLGELFLGFLRYYTYFDYEKYAISVRGGSMKLKEECRYAKSPKNDATQWKLLCIEEPFDLTNTARSVFDVGTFEHIKGVFRRSYQNLGETQNLNSIFPNHYQR